MKVTFSAIKADVGSIGGHTRPSERMLNRVKSMVEELRVSERALRQRLKDLGLR